MSDFNRGYPRTVTAGAADMSVDAGLRAFMLGVYNKVALGLLVSAVLAFAAAYVAPVHDLLFRSTPDGVTVGFTGLGQIVSFAPLAIVLFSGFFMHNATPASSGAVYWSVVSLLGLSLGVIVLAYSGASLATTFLITAIAFGGLSLVGYTTKKDLTGFGSFLVMGLIGIILAMVVNMFLHSSAIEFMVDVLGVFIFAGLIAWNTQKLKIMYYHLGGDQSAMSVATNYGALSLYLNFINLFMMLLRLSGGRR
jgi:FtsH-binding integral membrane protein